METTKNLKLPQYTGEDIFDLQDINKAYESIDKAYGDLDGARKEVDNIKNEIPKTNATAEVISARGGKETLGKRLDEFGSQLETKTSKEETKNIQVKLTNDIETINSQLDTTNHDIDKYILKYPLKLGVEDVLKVKDYRYPYLHVNRYGAIGDGKTDCSEAIQYAVDLAESYFNKNYRGGGNVIKFESGVYLITKTIKIKYDKNAHTTRPIWFEGVSSENIQSIAGGKSTQIMPLIPSQENLGYASAFSINSTFDGDIDLNVCNSGSTIPVSVCNGITFKNLIIQIGNSIEGSGNDLEIIDNYDIVGIKAFNTRLSVINCYFHGLNYGVMQPRTEGQCNDMSVFQNVKFSYPKYGGLYLTYADCCTISEIQSHYMNKDTFNSLIDIKEGSSITINNIHSAEYGIYEEGEEFIPKNLGSGSSGDKSVFKFTGCYGIELSNIYTERPFLDYVVMLESVSNIKIHGYNERFMGNGFIKIKGDCFNVSLDNIYRYGNLIEGYHDIFIDTQNLRSFKVKNFICKNYYKENLNLDSDYRRSQLTKLYDNVFRKIKINGITKEQYCNYNFNGENLNVVIYYDDSSSSFRVATHGGKGITHIFGSPTWETDGLILSPTLLYPFRINSVVNATTGTSMLTPILINTADEIKIKFFGSSQFISSPDIRINISINVDCICNLAEFSR